MTRIHTATIILFIWAAFFAAMRVYGAEPTGPVIRQPRECGAAYSEVRPPRGECEYWVHSI